MSITRFDSAETKATQANAQQKQAERTERAASTQGYRNPIKANDRSTRDNLRSPFATQANYGEQVQSVLTYVEGWKKRYTGPEEIGVEVISDNVFVPMVVLYLTSEIDGVKRLVTHGIMVADVAHPPEPWEYESYGSYNRGAEELAFSPTWADCLDDDYLDVMLGQLTAKEGEHIMVSGGCSVVDQNLIPSSKIDDDEKFRSGLLDNIIVSILNGLFALRANEERDFSCALTPENRSLNSIFVADLNLNATTATAPNGDPVAEDFSIVLKEQKFGQRNDNDRGPRSPNRRDGDAVATLGTVSGRVGFTLVGPEDNGSYRNPRLEDMAPWLTEFMITHFDVTDSVPSLPLILAMVSSVGHLGVDQNWLRGFMPKNLHNQTQRNLGALGAEVEDFETRKLNDRVNFPQTVEEDMFLQFVRGTIRPEARIGIEVPTHGPMVSVLQLFELAANGVMEAENAILDAAESVTGGEFSKIWQGGRVMCPQVNICPVATWIDSSNQPRDSRETGTLAVYNLDNNADALAMGRRMDDALNNPNHIQASNEIIDILQTVHGNITLTDNVRRVFFTVDFLYALNTALRNSKMDIQLAHNSRNRNNRRRRVDSGTFMSTSQFGDSYRFSNNGRRSNDQFNYGRQSYRGR